MNRIILFAIGFLIGLTMGKCSFEDYPEPDSIEKPAPKPQQRTNARRLV